MNQRTGIAATLSILAAIGSYILVFSSHPFWGILVSIAAVFLGVIGLIMAASPRVGGGVLSILGIVLGSIGFLVAILGSIGVIIF